MIDLVRTDKRTGEIVVVPICSAENFNRHWFVGAELLRLRLIPRMGALALYEREKQAFIDELELLKRWAAERPGEKYHAYMATKIDEIMELLIQSPLDAFEVSFG